MRSLSIAEIVGRLRSAKTKIERAEILKNNDSGALRGILRMNYDSSLILALPEGAPPYKSSQRPVGFGDTTLHASAKGWKYFVKELSPELTQPKREQMFIRLLEALDVQEAEILLKAKDRKLDIGVTKKLIDEVFPGLIKAEVKKNGKKESITQRTDTSDS